MEKLSILLSVVTIFIFTSSRLLAQCCVFSYQQQVEPITSAATFGVALGDFDKDGDQDAVSISAYYGVDVYFNNGSGTFTLNAQYATGSNGDFYGVHVCDVDGDEDADIIAIPFYSSASLTILKNNGFGIFTTNTVSSSIATYNAAIGDIDGDNDIDIFMPNAGGGSGKIFKNNSSGTYSLYQTLPGARGHDAELEDLDGDGDKDAWIGKSNNSSEIWLNNGSGTFTLYSTITTGTYCKAVNLYDFENDGDLDVFLGFYSSAPQIWINQGNLTFSLCYQAPVGSSSHGQAIGFINNDNRIDIYSGYFSNNNGDYVFLNNSLAIDYPNSPFCPYLLSPQNVTLTGSGGGIFTASPSGLVIDSISGAITPATSTPGTYLVNYTVGSCSANTPVTIKSLDLSTNVTGSTITANQGSATYQWIDCNNSFLPIAGETGQSYTATTSGNYAVIITSNGCTDTSSCVNIVVTGLCDHQEEYKLLIYPNPANAIINVKAEINIIGTAFIIYNQLGQAVLKGNLNEENNSIELGNLPTGLYTLCVGEIVKQTFKVMVE